MWREADRGQLAFFGAFWHPRGIRQSVGCREHDTVVTTGCESVVQTG